MADDNVFELEIIAPDRIFYQGEVMMVEFYTSEGQIGVLKGHIPLTTILEPGIIKITESTDKKEAIVHAGFAVITGSKVTLLAQLAEWPWEIDINRAKEAKTRAERRILEHDSDVALIHAEMELRKALLRIESAQDK